MSLWRPASEDVSPPTGARRAPLVTSTQRRGSHATADDAGGARAVRVDATGEGAGRDPDRAAAGDQRKRAAGRRRSPLYLSGRHGGDAAECVRRSWANDPVVE